MIKVDLITGFLGSGKTTFIKKYARYFLDKGLKIGILENDYGAVNVDMLLLNELRGENCELEMVAGGCDKDCHKRRFKTKLIAMGMSGYDRVLIEPSGIFDMDEFFDTLHEEPLDRWYEIGNVITVVDANLEDSLSADSDSYLATQVSNAGCIVMSRVDSVDDKRKSATVSHIKKALTSANLSDSIENKLITKSWDSLNSDDFERISSCGYHNSSYTKITAGKENDFSTLYFMEIPFTRESISEKIKNLMQDDSYGNVFRVKGFFCESDKWYQVNATKNELHIDTIPVGQEVVIVIGENLNEEKIEILMRES
ncbi:MAG: GTP-binding protein [Lachnospiraceae bacterium]|nr:GTP-binding protein [Lachnospiraceae bacterium]